MKLGLKSITFSRSSVASEIEITCCNRLQQFLLAADQFGGRPGCSLKWSSFERSALNATPVSFLKCLIEVPLGLRGSFLDKRLRQGRGANKRDHILSGGMGMVVFELCPRALERRRVWRRVSRIRAVGHPGQMNDTIRFGDGVHDQPTHTSEGCFKRVVLGEDMESRPGKRRMEGVAPIVQIKGGGGEKDDWGGHFQAFVSSILYRERPTRVEVGVGDKLGIQLLDSRDE